MAPRLLHNGAALPADVSLKGPAPPGLRRIEEHPRAPAALSSAQTLPPEMERRDRARISTASRRTSKSGTGKHNVSDHLVGANAPLGNRELRSGPTMWPSPAGRTARATRTPSLGAPCLVTAALRWIFVLAPLKQRIAVQERERRTSLGTLNVGQVTAQMTDSKNIFRYDGETRTLHYGHYAWGNDRPPTRRPDGRPGHCALLHWAIPS